MNRQSFGLWGADLDPDDFACALAALGVLYAAYGPHLLSQDPSVWLDTQQIEHGLFDALVTLVFHRSSVYPPRDPPPPPPDRVAPPIRWMLPPPNEIKATLVPASASVLADAWRQILYNADLNAIRIEIRLDQIVRRREPFEPLWSFVAFWESPAPAWQTDVDPFWVIAQLSRPTTRIAATYIAQEMPAPPLWGWPLQVGMLQDADSQRLRRGLENYAANSRHMLELRTLKAGAETCHLLIIPLKLRETLAHLLATPIKAGFVLLLTNLTEVWADVGPLIGALQSHVQAGGIAFMSLPRQADTRWLINVMRQLSHDLGIDRSLTQASGQFSQKPIIVSNQRFIEQTYLSSLARQLLTRMREEKLGPDMHFSMFSFGPKSSGTIDLGRLYREMRHRLEVTEPRWIQLQVFDYGDPRHPIPLVTWFRRNTLHAVEVRIGPLDSDWHAADTLFPDQALPESQQPHRLTIVFTEHQLGLEPQVAEVLLPTNGPSSSCRFFLRAGARSERIEARIIVLFQNRIIQTALLRAPVIAERWNTSFQGQIEVVIEAVVRKTTADLATRRRFDAAIIVNSTADGTDRITAIAGQRVGISYPEGLRTSIAHIRRDLGELVTTPHEYVRLNSPEMTQTLRVLARRGSTLYGAIVTDQLGAALVDAERIQVLSAKAEAYLPIEFIYDRESPDSDADLCPQSMAALKRGRCFDECGLHSPNRIICPLGFWGMSKEIERYSHTPEHAAEVKQLQSEYILENEPTSTRRHIGSIESVLLAASAKVNQYPKGKSTIMRLEESIAKHIPRMLAVDSWEAWVAGVEDQHPRLLILLPHTLTDQDDFKVLEISKAARLASDHIKPQYVRAVQEDTPIVFLLGCDTGDPTIPFEWFPTAFRRAGAAIVLATLTPILGRHAAPVAQRLVAALLRHTGKNMTFGSIMRQLRRDLLAEGYPIILALVAYGDADWVLGDAPDTEERAHV